MAVKIEKDGSFQVIYGGAWKGLNVEVPSNLLDDLSFPVKLYDWRSDSIVHLNKQPFKELATQLTGRAA